MVRLVGLGAEAHSGPVSKRGEIEGFTARSRMRLLRQLACIDQTRVESGLFVTLTYPGQFGSMYDPPSWKIELDTFIHRLRRRYPLAAGWWKLEPQKRGAPHFHLLLFGIPLDDLEDFKGWLSQSWYEVVDSGDLRHLAAGTSCERVRTWSGVMAYAGKYLGKSSAMRGLSPSMAEMWGKVGRWWGSFGRRHLPTGAIDLELSQAEFDQLRAEVLAVQDADFARRRAEMIARGVDLPERVNWLHQKPDFGAMSFMSWDNVRDLVKRVTGRDLADVPSRAMKPGEFSC